jgi:hypothetical protein
MARTLSRDPHAPEQVGLLWETARMRADGCRMLHMPDPQGTQEGIAIAIQCTCHAATLVPFSKRRGRRE